MDSVNSFAYHFKRQNLSWVMVTILDVKGSAYRGTGTQMLIADDGTTVGEISGGCLESDLVAHSKEIFEKRKGKIVSYTTGVGTDILWGTGLGCEGKIKIHLEFLQKEDQRLYAEVENRKNNGETISLALLLRGHKLQKLILDDSGAVIHSQTVIEQQSKFVDWLEKNGPPKFDQLINLGEDVWLYKSIVPPPQVFIFGAGDDAIPICQFANQLLWQVHLIDHREQQATAERFATVGNIIISNEVKAMDQLNLNSASIVLIMTHKYLIDKDLLKALLPKSLKYLGLLGPSKKGRKMLAELESEGFQWFPNQLDKFYSPMGLDIGAESSTEVALSIISEIQAVLTGKKGGQLKHKKRSIHERKHINT